MQLEGLSRVVFENSGLVIDGNRYFFREITSVYWSATVTQKSVNFVPVGKDYAATLSLTIKQKETVQVLPDRDWKGTLRHHAFDALARAAEAISDASFAHRVQVYENDLKERNFFIFGDFQIHRSGDVFKSGKKIFSLNDEGIRVSLDIFGITVSPATEGLLRSIFPKKYIIPLYTDKDCFLYLLKTQFGMYFSGHRVRQKKRDSREVFYRAAIELGAAMAAADGRVDPAELITLKDYFKISSEEFPEAGRWFNQQTERAFSASEVLGDLKKSFSNAPEALETFSYGIGLVALADGELDPKELALLEAAMAFIELPVEGRLRVLAALGISGQRKSQRNSSGRQASVQGAAYFYGLLGLKVGASAAEVKSAYRELAKRYHPDRLRSKSLPKEEVEKAQDLLKKVNEARDWIAKNN